MTRELFVYLMKPVSRVISGQEVGNKRRSMTRELETFRVFWKNIVSQFMQTKNPRTFNEAPSNILRALSST